MCMSKYIHLQLYHWISDGVHNQIVEEGQGDFNLQKEKICVKIYLTYQRRRVREGKRGRGPSLQIQLNIFLSQNQHKQTNRPRRKQTHAETNCPLLTNPLDMK
jgi:hypothetical protein